MPPAEDQLVNILLIVVVVHLQVLVNAQVLHFSNVSIPIGVGALLASDESICPNFKGIAQRGAQAGGILSGQVVKLRVGGMGWIASFIAATSVLISA